MTTFCTTCDGHRGEIDSRERFIPCGDCAGTGLDLSAPWADPMPGVTALLQNLAFPHSPRADAPAAGNHAGTGAERKLA